MFSAIKKVFSSDTQEFWIVFTKGSHFIRHFLKEDFSHIYVITRDKYNWVILNPLRLHFSIEIAPFTIKENVPRLITTDNDHVLKITMHKRHADKQFRYFGLMNCVSYVKYILGLRMYVLTPFGLYKRMLHLSDQEKIRHGIQSVKLFA